MKGKLEPFLSWWFPHVYQDARVKSSANVEDRSLAPCVSKCSISENVEPWMKTVAADKKNKAGYYLKTHRNRRLGKGK